SGACGESRTEGAEAALADFEAYVRDRKIAGGEQSLGSLHAAAREEIVRGFLEDAGEEALEVERRKTRFAGGAIQGHGIGDRRREEIARTAEAAKRDIVHQGHRR